jgi:hypothetical protein
VLAAITAFTLPSQIEMGGMKKRCPTSIADAGHLVRR